MPGPSSAWLEVADRQERTIDPPGLALLPGQIHLWVCRDAQIDAPSLLAEYACTLEQEEAARLSRLYFERHRHQFLVTRAMVRHVLSLYRPQIGPGAWRFRHNHHGKPGIDPALDPEGRLHFNVSHTDGLIVMAVASQPVGVDVEHLGREGATLSVADTFFSSRERQDLQDCSALLRQRRFYELWTLKEAYVKACGQGLAIPLDSFAFRLGLRGPRSLAFEHLAGAAQRWRFWSLMLCPDFCIALAACASGDPEALAPSVAGIVPGLPPYPVRCSYRWCDLPIDRLVVSAIPGALPARP